MKTKLLSLLCLILLISACAKKEIPTNTLVCTSSKEEIGTKEEISFTYSNDICLTIVQAISVDVTAASSSSVAEVLKELQETSEFYNEDVPGISYEFSSEGSVVYKTVTIDLTTLAYPRLIRLGICDSDTINGNDSGYTISAIALQKYLENSPSFGGSCKIK